MSYFVKTTTSIKQNYQFLELEDYINFVKTEKYNEINEDIKNAVLSITNLRDKTQFNKLIENAIGMEYKKYLRRCLDDNQVNIVY